MDNRIQELLMKTLDNELSDSEREEVEALKKKDSTFQKELDKLLLMRKQTDKIQLAKPIPEVWDEYWTNVYYRFERKVGWIFLSIGSIILVGFGLYEFFSELMDSDQPGVIKFGIAGTALGLAILFISVFRERIVLRKSDKYKDIIR